MANQRILLFGGTFDPIHNAHVAIARSVAEHLAAEKIILIPSANPPHKDNEVITAADLRLRMCQAAIADDDLFDVCDCELHRPGPSYTLDTVQQFRDLYGPKTLNYWLIGADSIADLPGWYRIKELVECCTLITARRPGSETPDFSSLEAILTDQQIQRLKSNCLESPLLDISATDIRQRVGQGLSIADLVPTSVEAFIVQNKLYC